MGLFDVTSSALEVAIRGTESRQTVLANNLANVNTPGFKRSDVSFQGALASALSSANGNTAAVDDTSFQTTTDTSTSMRADGNNVDVDVESANLSKNQLLFDSVMAIDTKRLHTMDTAITGAH
ncbi:MAG TPA: flagellar basal body rod protein FlgB [Gaiellales bacterium]|jgi:flagellar basal-body rod protein FlgB